MNPEKLTLDILICTIGDGLLKVPDMLLPERDGVRYVISVQQAGKNTPSLLKSRKDVTIDKIDGAGLSRNRNNAIRIATSDICLIADDDNRYLPEYIDNILKSWQDSPDADIITFQAENYQGEPLHPYPAPYISSVEITFRRSAIIEKGLKFDERFGIGGQLFCAGEEDVFMADARRAGLNILYMPTVIVRTQAATTGSKLIGNRKLQVTKGATFRYVYGTNSAIWRSFKESGWYLFHKGSNPFPIFFNMIRGIWTLR